MTEVDHLSSVLTFLLWRSAMAVSGCLGRWRGGTTAVLAVRVSVRPAPPTACLCLRGAGAGSRCEFVMPATSKEELHKPPRVRIQTSCTDICRTSSSQCRTIPHTAPLDGALQWVLIAWSFVVQFYCTCICIYSCSLVCRILNDCFCFLQWHRRSPRLLWPAGWRRWRSLRWTWSPLQ